MIPTHGLPADQLASFAILADRLLMREGDLVQNQPVAFFYEGVPFIADRTFVGKQGPERDHAPA